MDKSDTYIDSEEKVELTGVKNGDPDAYIDSEEKVELTGVKNGDPSKCRPVKVSLRTKLKDRDYRRKCLNTLWFGAAFWALGFVISQRGPTFLDLQIITQTNVEEASYFFTASSIGYLMGSLVAGMVYDRFNKSLLLLLYLMGMAITTVAVPWCSIYGLMVAIHVVFSLFAGGLETVGNAEMVRVWGKEGEGAMQFIHFAYAFGGVIAPLVTEPFLTPIPEEDDNMTTTTQVTPSTIQNTAFPVSAGYATNLPVPINHSTSSFLVADMGTSVSAFSSSEHVWNATTVSSMNVTDSAAAQSLPVSTRVHFAYLITGCLIVLIMIPVTVQLFTDRSQKRRRTQENKEKKDVKQPLPLCLFLFVLGALCVFNFMNVAVEDTFSSFLLAFVVRQLNWSKSSGAKVTSTFWAVFAVCRFLSIFAVHIISSAKLLLLSCSALAGSMLLFLLCASHSVTVGVWVSAALVGASIAAIFPTGFSWMEEELVRVTGRVASTAVIAASAGSSASPLLLGFLMQRLTPMWFAYLLFGQAAVCLLVFLFLLALSRLYLRKHYTMKRQSQEQETFVSAQQEDSKAGGESTF